MKKTKSKKEDYELFDEDEEDLLPKQFDKNVVFLRQIDRINKIAAAGDTAAWINSIEQLENMLAADIESDTLYKTRLTTELKTCEEAKKRHRNDEDAIFNLNAEFYQQKYKLLIILLNRRGMW